MDEIGLKFHPDVGQFLAHPSARNSTLNINVTAEDVTHKPERDATLS